MRTLTKTIILMSLAVAVAGGCNRISHQDDRERKGRLMIKAYAMTQEGHYDEAISLCRKVIETNPGFARPHLDVALLLQDHKKDYIAAIYHYRKYLEMRPGSEKKNMILQRIRQAEDSFVAVRMKKTSPGLVSIQEVESRCEVLKKKNTALKSRVAELKEELGAIRDVEHQKYIESVAGDLGKVSDPAAEIQSPPKEVKTPPKKSSKSQKTKNDRKAVSHRVSSAAAKKPQPAARKPKSSKTKSSTEPKTYTVMRGDSLTKIAHKMYGDADLYTKIQAANKKILKGKKKDEVQIGQVLVIPDL